MKAETLSGLENEASKGWPLMLVGRADIQRLLKERRVLMEAISWIFHYKPDLEGKITLYPTDLLRIYEAATYATEERDEP